MPISDIYLHKPFQHIGHYNTRMDYFWHKLLASRLLLVRSVDSIHSRIAPGNTLFRPRNQITEEDPEYLDTQRNRETPLLHQTTNMSTNFLIIYFLHHCLKGHRGKFWVNFLLLYILIKSDFYTCFIDKSFICALCLWTYCSIVVLFYYLDYERVF